MDRVLQIDDVSRAALIQAGATGPALEKQLRALELTLRFYPQSFELSTLGGWIATRAGGHFATVETHIDDLVESVRAITPSGAWESRRLPGSGAGPSPDRMLLGSEGILGVITEAWVRVRPRPQAHSLAAVRFADFARRDRDALRAIAQSGLRPSNCRLIDAEEARMTGAADGTAALLVLGFEGASEAVAPVGELLDRALLHLRRGRRRVGRGRGAPAALRRRPGRRRRRRRRLADGVLPRAVPARRVRLDGDPVGDVRDRDHVGALRRAARRGDRGAASEAIGPAGRITCRISHVYPDGAGAVLHGAGTGAPRRGARAVGGDQGRRVATRCSPRARRSPTTTRSAATTAPWYDRQRPDAVRGRAARGQGGRRPGGALNPGVLIDA